MLTRGVALVAHRWAYPPLPPKAIISPLLEKAHAVTASPSVSICIAETESVNDCIPPLHLSFAAAFTKPSYLLVEQLVKPFSIIIQQGCPWFNNLKKCFESKFSKHDIANTLVETPEFEQ